MGRQRKDDKPRAADAGASPAGGAKKKTGLIRIDEDLVRKLSIISTARGQDIKDIVGPHLRPFVERLYADVVRQLGQDVADPPPK